MLKHGQITDCEVYWEDNTLFGIANEVTLPSLEHDYVEHETLGSIGVLKLPKRGLKALDFGIKIAFPEPTLWPLLHVPNVTRVLQVHQKIDVFDENGLNADDSTIMVSVFRVSFGKVTEPGLKKGDDMIYEAEGACAAFTQRFYNSETPIVEVNLFQRIYNVMGKPIWS